MGRTWLLWGKLFFERLFSTWKRMGHQNEWDICPKSSLKTDTLDTEGVLSVAIQSSCSRPSSKRIAE